MRFNWTAIALPLLALAMRLASAPTAEASYVVLGVHALFGRAQAVQALGMAWLFAMLSRGIGPESSATSVGFFVVLASAAASVLARPAVRYGAKLSIAPVAATLLLGVFLLAHSALFSQIPEVSLLKAVSWIVTTSTLFAAWNGLSDAEHARLEAQIFGGLLLILALSLPLLPTELGYLVNGTGFQGVLGHPQAFGATMALLAAWLMSKMVSDANISWPRAGLLGMALVLVILSEARTAGLGVLLGLLAAVPLSAYFSRVPLRSLLPGLFSSRMHLIVVLMFVGGLLAGAALTNRLEDFLQKRDETPSITDAYQLSRGRLMDAMWANIDQFPYQGIGFGVPSDPMLLEVERDPIFDLPVSASIEKGVMPLQVLEEMGIPGFVAVAVWLCVILVHVVRGGLVPVAVVMTALALNFGEAMLFSPRGVGLIVLILISWAGTARGRFPGRRYAGG